MYAFRMTKPVLMIFVLFLIASVLTVQAHAAGIAAPESAPQPESAKPAADDLSGKLLRLPEPISASALHSMITSASAAFEMVDIRPAEQFSDYHIPGSRNVAFAVVLSDPGFLAGAVPLILIDRDGSRAMAIGGILSQKTERPVRVLSGGLEAYWSATDRIAGPRMVPGATRPAIQPPAPQPETVSPPAAPASPARRKSAGC